MGAIALSGTPSGTPQRPYVGCTADSTWQRACLSEATVFDVYEIGGLLGSGSFGQVRQATALNQCDNNRQYAVKIVDTKGEVYRHVSNYISARQEATILKTIRHPHIVELVDVFERERWLFLVMECVTGGELFMAIADPDVGVTEGCIATVGRQLLQALKHLHDLSVVHRDVKAENILLVQSPAKTSNWHIKLIDFGLAMRIEQPACFFQMCREQEMPIEELICGTAYYCAPEVWVNDYGPKVDVWAAGVVLYLALLGTFPFYDSDPSALEALICNPNSEPAFKPVGAKDCPSYEVSHVARKCITSLLDKDSDTRPAASAALHGSWFRDNKRIESICGTPRPKPQGVVTRARTGTSDSQSFLDQAIPMGVRAKAGRAAAQPPVDLVKEQSRTDALEALKARAALCGSPCNGKQAHLSRQSSASWRSPRCQSRELEVDAAEPCPAGSVPILSWVEHDLAPADTSLTDSDVDEVAVCTCR